MPKLSLSPLRLLYLVLATWGALHPMAFLMVWFTANGLDLATLGAAWHANPATSALVWDLTIAAVALTVWIAAEVAVRRNWSALVAIPVTFVIGVGCGLPLYLFLRTRPV